MFTRLFRGPTYAGLYRIYIYLMKYLFHKKYYSKSVKGRNKIYDTHQLYRHSHQGNFDLPRFVPPPTFIINLSLDTVCSVPSVIRHKCLINSYYGHQLCQRFILKQMSDNWYKIIVL